MPAIYIPRKTYSQPQGRVTVDWSSPLSRDLVMLVNMTSGLNVVNGVMPAATGATSTAIAEYSGMRFSGANSRLDFGQSRVIPGGSSACTVSALGYWPATGRGHAFSQGLQTSPYPSSSLGYGLSELASTSVSRIAFYEYGGGGTQAMSASAATSAGVADGKLHFVSGVRNGAASNTRIYVDGVNRTSATAGNSNYIDSSSQYLSIGNDSNYGGTDRVFNAPLFLVVIHSSALTADEIKDFSDSPWQLFKSEPLRIYSFPSVPILIPTLSAPSFAGRVPSVSLTY